MALPPRTLPPSVRFVPLSVHSALTLSRLKSPLGRPHAREPPFNPNPNPSLRPTWGVHTLRLWSCGQYNHNSTCGSGAHACVMVQRPPNGTNGAKPTEMAFWLLWFLSQLRFLGAKRAGRPTHWPRIGRGEPCVIGARGLGRTRLHARLGFDRWRLGVLGGRGAFAQMPLCVCPTVPPRVK